MYKAIEFKRVNLVEDKKYPLYVYDAVIDKSKIDSDIMVALEQSYFLGDVRNIRICKDRGNRTWRVQVTTVRQWGEFKVENEGIKTLKEAKEWADLAYNPYY